MILLSYHVPSQGSRHQMLSLLFYACLLIVFAHMMNTLEYKRIII